MCAQFLYGHMFPILWGIYPGMELQGHMVTICLMFWGAAKLFSTAPAQFYILTSNVWGF